MEMSNTLARDERLRQRGTIGRLFESGESGFAYPLRYTWLLEDATSGATPTCEVLFTVPKRLHKRANKRNLLRRYIKESYRQQKSTLLLSTNRAVSIKMAIVYSTKELNTQERIAKAMDKLLSDVAKTL